jgi:putative FmdB family regulatory protein
MPLYEYQCEKCSTTFEVIQRFADPPVDRCRSCGGPVHRLLSAPAIHFKGTGWYITDYARKSKTDGGASPASSPSTTTESNASAPPDKSGTGNSTPPSSPAPGTAEKKA